jgi:3-deoxy-D-manno-octulosonate 8-phosphate phosphatase (KDO 8-P phosphatase)
MTEVRERAARLRLLLLDVDGVLTDGTVAIDSAGGEAKSFFIRDGASMIWAKRAGLEVGLLSGRPSQATSRRAAELGIRIVSQRGTDKLAGYREILAAEGLRDEDIGYMGDDMLDLPVLARAGLSAAPADSAADVRARVHWVSQHPGGRGAVREFIELVLVAQGKWDGVLATHLI